jgi:hypothetical protein
MPSINKDFKEDKKERFYFNLIKINLLELD